MMWYTVSMLITSAIFEYAVVQLGRFALRQEFFILTAFRQNQWGIDCALPSWATHSLSKHYTYECRCPWNCDLFELELSLFGIYMDKIDSSRMTHSAIDSWLAFGGNSVRYLVVCLCASEYVIKRENNQKESVLYVHIRRKQASSLLCLWSLFIAIKFTVLHIRVLWVKMEEPVDNEPNVGSHKQKGKIRVTARDTLSDSNILSDNGQAD